MRAGDWEPEKLKAMRFVCRSVYLKYGDIYSQDRVEAVFCFVLFTESFHLI